MKRIFALFVIALCLASPLVPAFAQEPSTDGTGSATGSVDAGMVPGPDGVDVPVPVNTDSPDEIFMFIARSFNAKNWGLFAAGVLMMLVWVGRLIMPRLPTKALPWVAAVLGMLFATGTAMSVGWVWWKAVMSGVLVGFAAGGLWDLVGQYILPTKKLESKPVVEDPKKPA